MQETLFVFFLFCMEFRSYLSSEADAIEDLFRSVFSESEGEAEGLLIGNLARTLLLETSPDDIFVFVAVQSGDIIASIILTRMPSENETEIFMLAPVAVATKFQGKGVGQGLIRYGIRKLREGGVKLLVTYGDPNFYSKTGFEKADESELIPPYKLSQPEGWLAQFLADDPFKVVGKCTCVCAFNNPAFW